MRTSRRQILRGALALPFVPASPGPSILTENHCLSEESARAFQRLAYAPGVIVAAGMRNLSTERARELRRRVIGGAWLIFECAPSFSTRQALLLLNEFQLRASPAASQSGEEWRGNYVEYQRPIDRWVRPFSAVAAIDPAGAQSLAQMNGVTVAVKRKLGNGTIVFLGSMLGPGLFAGEREAHQVAAALLLPRALRS